MWLYPNGDTFTIFDVEPTLPGLIYLDKLPEGYGILSRHEDGTFYYKPHPSPVIPEPPVDPVIPETIEQKLARMELQLIEQQQQNLILLDVNMTIYEELLLMQERLSSV